MFLTYMRSANPIHPGHILRDVLILVIVGVLLWALNQVDQIDAKYKKLINVIVIVATVIWMIYDLFGDFFD